MEKILQGESWSFDRHLVILQRYEIDTLITDLLFDKVSLWVQVHDIPVHYLNRDVAKKLCELVDEVDRTLEILEVEGGSFIRVQVRWILIYLFVKVVYSPLKIVEKIGSPSTTNTFLISAIGVDDLIMLIEIAIFGLKVIVRWKPGIKNMGRGFMPRLLHYIRSNWWLSWFFMQQRKRLVRMVLGKGRGSQVSDHGNHRG